MSELAAFLALGFHHIINTGALDHLLFLVVLAACYRGRDWPDAIRVITGFTVGHSVTLALAAAEAMQLPTSAIEFLIPVTIVVTGMENALVRDRGIAPWRGWYRPLVAGVFGLVHGAGFANYLRGIFDGSLVIALLGFNLGIELGQILVLTGACLAMAALDRVMAPRTRTVMVSVAVVIVAAGMAIDRAPW
jgi:hypothetical protein